jgi:hypothetical protein
MKRIWLLNSFKADLNRRTKAHRALMPNIPIINTIKRCRIDYGLLVTNQKVFGLVPI